MYLYIDSMVSTLLTASVKKKSNRVIGQSSHLMLSFELDDFVEQISAAHPPLLMETSAFVLGLCQWC